VPRIQLQRDWQLPHGFGIPAGRGQRQPVVDVGAGRLRRECDGASSPTVHFS
jgi:hypothetical protein